jgi:hypothetical protein
MLLASWGYRTNPYTSSRKNKKTDRVSCDAEFRLA